MISDPFYSWIPQYVFGKNQIYKSYDNKQPAMTQRVLLVIDWGFIHVMSGHDKHAEQLRSIYANTMRILSITENALKYNYNIFPYTNLREHSFWSEGIAAQCRVYCRLHRIRRSSCYIERVRDRTICRVIFAFEPL